MGFGYQRVRAGSLPKDHALQAGLVALGLPKDFFVKLVRGAGQGQRLGRHFAARDELIDEVGRGRAGILLRMFLSPDPDELRPPRSCVRRSDENQSNTCRCSWSRIFHRFGLCSKVMRELLPGDHASEGGALFLEFFDFRG